MFYLFWKIRHFLFGTHFVHLDNGFKQIVRAIKINASGERYCIYFDNNFIFIDRPQINWTITPMTWVEPNICQSKVLTRG